MEPVTLQDQALTVTITEEDKRLWLQLTDRANGKDWGRWPLMTLEIHDKAVRYTDLVPQYRLDRVQKVEGGVRVDVTSPRHSVSVGLWVRLTGGELSVMLSPGEVYERNSRLYRLFAVDVLPGLMRSGPGGTILLPVASGVTFDPAGKPERRDAFLVYGEQERWELVPTIPLCAARDQAGGLLALAVSGDSDARCNVATDGKGAGCTGFAFTLRRYWPDPVDFDLREYRYVPVPPKADLVFFAAKRLRKHAVEELGKPTLAQRAEESPEVRYLLDAYIMKLFHGVENEGAMMTGAQKGNPVSFVDVMTFAECSALLKKLRDAGVQKILTESVGWNLRGHDGLYPTRFPIEPRLGGEKGFRQMIADGNDLGYHMSVHDNYFMNVHNSPDFDPDTITRDLYGEPLVHGWWGGGIEYASWGLALPEERLTGHMRKMKALGLRGTYYMDYMAQPLETNYHPKHGGPRGDHVRGMRRIVHAAREVFGSAAVEFGFLPMAIDCELTVNCGQPWHLKCCRPEWAITPLLDKLVPVWQIAFHGLTMKEAHGLDWPAAMNAVVMGERPRDEWSARPGVMPVLDDRRVAALKAMYDLAVARFGYLQTLEMTGYQEPAERVVATEFEDGTKIVADYNEQRLTVSGKQVDQPAGL